MRRTSTHGLTFTLYHDPEGTPWIEILREETDQVIVSDRFDGGDDEFDDAVEEWIRTRLMDGVPEPSFPRCGGCGNRLHPVYPDSADCNQFDDALVLHFEGGYGMFTDLNQIIAVVICKTCAQHLVDTNPWIGRILDDDD